MVLVNGLASFMVSEFLISLAFLVLWLCRGCVVMSSLLGIYIFVMCSLISQAPPCTCFLPSQLYDSYLWLITKTLSSLNFRFFLISLAAYISW